MIAMPTDPLKLEIEIEEVNSRLDWEDTVNIIETKKLTKYYGKSMGIEDVDLVVKQGEIFGFIGPNGAGKSTTIRTLLGLIHPTGGSATIFGRDVTKFGPEIKQEIGYLPSEVFLLRRHARHRSVAVFR